MSVAGARSEPPEGATPAHRFAEPEPELEPGDVCAPPDPGSALVVTTVGGTLVATDGMLAHADRVGRIAGELHDALVRVDYAALLGPLPTDALRAELAAALRCADDQCAAIREAAQLAELGEDRILRAQTATAGLLAAAVAGAWPALLALGVGWSPVLAFAALAMTDEYGGDDAAARREGVVRWLLDHPELITSPGFVDAVRLVATSTDDAGWAALGVPAPLAAELGSQQHGVTGVESSAIGIMGAAGLVGLLRETPVTVERTGTSVGAAPAQGAVQRLDRVPDGGDIVIERHDVPGGEPRWVVYVGPTETFSPSADGPAFDQTSNMAGVAGLPAGSMRALEMAMADAGVAATDQVQLVGFSQGGLVAARAAESGQWNVVGLETYGAPTGNVELPEGLAGMAVRHTDDLVPALAGPQLDDNLLQVEREAFAGDAPPPTGLPAPAHQKAAYLATAAAIDGAQSAAVREQVAALDAFTAEYAAIDGATVTTFSFHAERVTP